MRARFDMSVYGSVPLVPGCPVNLNGERVGTVVGVTAKGWVEAELDDDVVERMIRAGSGSGSIQMVLNAVT
jgi:hypothetical protein